MFKKIINFFKYHNAFAIGISLVLVLTFSAMASGDVRNAVIGEKIVTEQGIDNSQLLAANLENSDINLKINNILEDEENYYVDYSFNTFGVKDNVWQPILKTERFTVNKTALGNRDLGIYLAEEFSELARGELTYLKEAQKTERERGLTQIVRTTDYTGLIGLTLDLKNKILPGYEPVIKPPVVEVVQEPIVEEIVCQPTTEVCDSIDNDCDGEVDENGVCETVAPPAGEEFPVKEEPSFEEEPPAEDVCDTAHLNLCTTQAECETAAGFWYNEGCNAEPEAPAEPEEPVCNSEHLDLCNTQELCEAASLYWYNETCNTETEGPETPACQPTEEVCDGLDNDCDELIDEDLGQTTCGIGACQVTIDNCIGGQPQTCTPGTPTEEICKQIDNNCNGQIDEGSVCQTPPPEQPTE